LKLQAVVAMKRSLEIQGNAAIAVAQAFTIRDALSAFLDTLSRSIGALVGCGVTRIVAAGGLVVDGALDAGA
jgi:hypothetical protein